MKRLVLLAALPFVFLSCSPKDPSDPKFVVAKGKGVKITRAELDKETKEKLQAMGLPVGQMPAAQLKMFEPQILDQMINVNLVLDAAEKAGIKDVSKKVDEEFVRATNGMDKAELEKRLASENLTEASVKEMLRKKVLIQEFLETKLAKDVAVSDEQVAAFYKEHQDKFKEPELVKVQEITVLLAQDATPAEKAAKEKIMKDARARLVKGEPFEKVAAEVSEDSAKGTGGMMEPFPKGSQAPEFEKVAFSAKVDVLSPIFSTGRGLHVLKVKERTQERELPFAEVKEWIKGKLSEEERNKEAKTYLDNLRKDADVKIMLPEPEVPKDPVSPQVQMANPEAEKKP